MFQGVQRTPVPSGNLQRNHAAVEIEHHNLCVQSCRTDHPIEVSEFVRGCVPEIPLPLLPEEWSKIHPLNFDDLKRVPAACVQVEILAPYHELPQTAGQASLEQHYVPGPGVQQHPKPFAVHLKAYNDVDSAGFLSDFKWDGSFHGGPPEEDHLFAPIVETEVLSGQEVQ